MLQLKNFMARLREPSTLAGLSMLAVVFGVDVTTADAVAQAVAGVLAAAAVIVPEAKAE